MLNKKYDNPKQNYIFRYLFLSKLFKLSQKNYIKNIMVMIITLAIVMLDRTAMSLVKTISLMRAEHQQTNTIENKAMFLTEDAVANYIDYIKTYPQIATYCTDLTSPHCNTTNSKTWSTLTKVDLSSGDGNNANYCDGVTSTSDYLYTSEVIGKINNATTTWTYSGNNTKYQLVEYAYDQTKGLGIMTIESQTTDGSGEYAMVQIKFPVSVSTNTSSNNIEIPGIWVQEDSTSIQVSNDQLLNASARQECSQPHLVQSGKSSLLKDIFTKNGDGSVQAMFMMGQFLL